MNHADTNGQPVPTGSGRRVVDAVMEDMQFRRQHGITKYGTELLTHNGRDALVDAYQEALDLVVYLKQELMERDAKTSAENKRSATGDVLPGANDMDSATVQRLPI